MMRFLTIPFALTGLAAADSLPLIPLPVSVRTGEGAFGFSAATAIRFDRSLKAEADLLAEELKACTGSAPKIAGEELRIFFPSEIRLDMDAAASLPASGYFADRGCPNREGCRRMILPKNCLRSLLSITPALSGGA